MSAEERSARVAVVTGASSGIGAATAKTLAGLGFHVVCAARRADRITALAAEIGGTAVVTDVTDQASVDALAAQVDALGPVHVLVNNAGGAKGLAPVAEADLEHWDWMWQTNVLGTLRVTRALSRTAPKGPSPSPCLQSLGTSRWHRARPLRRHRHDSARRRRTRQARHQHRHVRRLLPPGPVADE